MSGTGSLALQVFLNRLVARSDLGMEEQEAILALPTDIVTLKARRDFAHVDEISTHTRLVFSGMVGRFGQTRKGIRQITAFYIPNDMIDLNAAVASVKLGGLCALCETTVLCISHRAIRALTTRYPAIAEAFWRDCMLDAAILTRWIVNVGRRDARQRVAHLLCEMACRAGESRRPLLTYSLPITQEQLGDAVALTSVHVNRMLSDFRASGLATFKAGRVDIHDWTAFARLGDFEPSYLWPEPSAKDGWTSAQEIGSTVRMPLD